MTLPSSRHDTEVTKAEHKIKSCRRPKLEKGLPFRSCS